MTIEQIAARLRAGGSVDCVRAGIWDSCREWHVVVNGRTHGQPLAALLDVVHVKRRRPTCPDCLRVLGLSEEDGLEMARAARWRPPRSMRARARRRYRQTHRRRAR